MKTTIYIENDNLYRKRRFTSKTTTKTTIFNQIWPIFNIIELFRYKIKFRIEIGLGFRIVTMMPMDFSNNFGSKKLNKSRFEYHLKRNLDGDRLDRISLVKAFVALYMFQKYVNSNIRKDWKQLFYTLLIAGQNHCFQSLSTAG